MPTCLARRPFGGCLPTHMIAIWAVRCVGQVNIDFCTPVFPLQDSPSHRKTLTVFVFGALSWHKCRSRYTRASERLVQRFFEAPLLPTPVLIIGARLIVAHP